MITCHSVKVLPLRNITGATPWLAAGPAGLPDRQAGLLALALTFAAAVGWSWARHVRAQADLKAAKDGLNKARRTADAARMTLWLLLATVAVVAKLWLDRHSR